MPEELKDSESVLLTSWIPVHEEYIDDKLEAKWEKLSTLRKEVNKKIEERRQKGEIGLALDARVVLNIQNKDYEFVKEYSDWDLSDIFLVSQIAYETTPLEKTEIEGVTVRIDRALGEKCQRCWKYSTEIGDSEFGQVTPRDAEVLRLMKQNGELDEKE